MRGIHRVLAGAATALAVFFASSLASAEFPKPTYDHHAKRSAVSAQRSAKPAQAKPTATTRTKAKPAQKAKSVAKKSKPSPPAKKR